MPGIQSVLTKQESPLLSSMVVTAPCTYTHIAVQIPGYSHNRAVTLTHGAELTGRSRHSPAVAMNLSMSFQETHASFYTNVPALDCNNCCGFLRENEAGTFPRPQGDKPGWENGSPSLPVNLWATSIWLGLATPGAYAPSLEM